MIVRSGDGINGSPSTGWMNGDVTGLSTSFPTDSSERFMVLCIVYHFVFDNGT